MRDKRERFVALAEARTQKALNAIRIVGNLSNKGNYDYTPEDVSQIVQALESEVRVLKSRFGEAGSSSQTTFRLKKAGS